MGSLWALTRRVFNVLVYFLSGLSPRDSNRLLFGAWHGERYADNSKYLFEYLAANEPGLDLVWCGREDLRSRIIDAPNVRFVRFGSARAFRECLRAGVCFVSHGTADLCPIPVFQGCRRFYLGHGIAIKNMGTPPDADGGAVLSFLRSIWRRSSAFEHWISSSPEHTTKLLSENQRALIERSQILEVGQPRLDPLFESRVDDFIKRPIRARLEKEYGLPADARLISYLPTFRDSGAAAFSFGGLESEAREALARVLEPHGGWIAEKSHFAEAGSTHRDREVSRYIDLSRERGIDTQDLLIATDILVTDYSGCYVDFLILDRPIIHFAYDYNSYVSRDRGMYFELNDIAGGDVVFDFDALLESIRLELVDPSRRSEGRQRLQKRLLSREEGGSRLAVAEFVKRRVDAPGRIGTS